jgi:hypothetical protein
MTVRSLAQLTALSGLPNPNPRAIARRVLDTAGTLDQTILLPKITRALTAAQAQYELGQAAADTAAGRSSATVAELAAADALLAELP